MGIVPAATATLVGRRRGNGTAAANILVSPWRHAHARTRHMTMGAARQCRRRSGRARARAAGYLLGGLLFVACIDVCASSSLSQLCKEERGGAGGRRKKKRD